MPQKLGGPRPGRPVRGSRTGKPLMALLDLLGRRWALRIVWELRDGPHSFRALRARCDDVSPSVLNLRLRELRGAGIVAVERATGYRVTEEGRRLCGALDGLQAWADGWERRERKILQAAPEASRENRRGSPEEEE
jgi:DNA-binding HxlR family transcriptional regulator